ncbi:hypothetical protein FHR72_001099 [Mycolicibacterium iranicum]|uniref:DUF2293 domain-containing protein n=2 Tax=Mycolicibacterium iranicum TaxID=912594 RepID=A0A839Q5Y0_MYCIR|nr:hypothetical protein [Mycolicibacterium iranicum]
MSTAAADSAHRVPLCLHHADTGYDDLILSGVEPYDARRLVEPRVEDIPDTWRSGIVEQHL